MRKEKEVTIYDIARQLDLSAATVSRGLNNHPGLNILTKKRISTLAKELGYRTNTFASNLRKQHSNTIGVIVHELNSNFITSVLAGIEKVTAETNYDLIIGHSSESYKKEIANANNFFHKRVDGLIASLAFDTENLSHFSPFIKKGIPVLFFDRVFENEEGTKVVINNFQAGYDATSHLIEQGCTRIAHITASLKRNVYADRLKGYQQALSDHQLVYQEEMVVVRGLSEEASLDAAQQILKMNPLPDGIFITNDFCAAICMQALKDAGLHIPDDIAIVGFNNDVISKVVEPKLTTIDYPGFEIGEIVARNLVNHLQGISNINLTNTIIVKSELIVRQSSLKKKQ
jgi:LacI family transcriptional regulator